MEPSIEFFIGLLATIGIGTATLRVFGLQSVALEFKLGWPLVSVAIAWSAAGVFMRWDSPLAAGCSLGIIHLGLIVIHPIRIDPTKDKPTLRVLLTRRILIAGCAVAAFIFLLTKWAFVQ